MPDNRGGDVRRQESLTGLAHDFGHIDLRRAQILLDELGVEFYRASGFEAGDADGVPLMFVPMKKSLKVNVECRVPNSE